MQLQINKDVLVNALQKVEKAVGRTTTIPVLSGIYFETTPDILKLIGTSEEQTISVEIPVDETIIVNKPGKIVLAKGITEIVKKLRSNIISISTDENTFQYNVEAGNSKFNFSGYDAEEFPVFSEPSNEPILEFHYEELKEYVDKLAFAASTEEGRPVLMGVQIIGEAGTDQLKFVSTNSYILSQKVVSKEIKEDVSILPKARGLVEALRVFNTSDTIKIFSTSTHLIFKSSEVTVLSRLLEGKFPDTSRLVVTEYKAILELDKEEVLAALEQLLIIGQNAQRNSALATLVGENLKIENISTELGKAEIELPLIEMQKHEENLEVKFAFDVKYMINLIKATDGNIKIAYVGNLKPISILGTEANGEYKLILPIRV